MRKQTINRDQTSTIIWDNLEEWARTKVQEFIQSLLEEEITELLGRQKSERRQAVDSLPIYRTVAFEFMIALYHYNKTPLNCEIDSEHALHQLHKTAMFTVFGLGLKVVECQERHLLLPDTEGPVNKCEAVP